MIFSQECGWFFIVALLSHSAGLHVRTQIGDSLSLGALQSNSSVLVGDGARDQSILDGRVLQVSKIDLKPIADQRLYQHAVLSNGIEVVNVQDTKTLQVAIAVAVTAGSYYDPLALPGLAHFCEHMLFLGSEKYPDPDGFNNFMSQYNAGHNAYTAAEVTNYFVELMAAGGEEGMDRLANFFKKPLFNDTYVQHEVNAVNSEHAKNVDNPQWFVLEAMLHASSPDNPMSRFSTGDLHTLWEEPKEAGINVVSSLRTYFDGEYCPTRMKVVTFGAEPLDVQLNRTAEKFADAGSQDPTCRPAERQMAEDFATPPAWPAARLGKWQNIMGNNPSSQLWLLFAFPDLTSTFRSDPVAYLDHVLTYRGENSFYLLLQDKLGLVSDLGLMMDSSTAGTNLFIMFDLTSLGRAHQDVILDLFFIYLATLRLKDVDEALYKSLASLSRLQWNWSQPSGPSSTASGLSEALTKFPAETILWANSLITEVNVSLVQSLMDEMVPSNMNVAYLSVANETGLFDDQEVLVLPHYLRQYSLRNISDVVPGKLEQWSSWLSGGQSLQVLNASLVQTIQQANLPNISQETLELPEVPRPIAGIPKDISIEHMTASPAANGTAGEVSMLFGAGPQIVGEDIKLGGNLNDSYLRYRSGWITFSPKVQLQIALRPIQPLSKAATSAYDLTRLGIYSSLFMAELGPKMVDLEAAGSSSSLDLNSDGIFITLQGFAPMLPDLAKTLLEELASFDKSDSINMIRYNRFVEEQTKNYRTYTQNAINYALGDRSLLIQDGVYSRQEMLGALAALSPKDVQSAARDLLFDIPLHATSLAMGNFDASAAKDLTTFVLDSFANLTAAKISTKLEEGAQVQLVDKTVGVEHPVELRLVNPKPGDDNDAMVLTLLEGVADISSRVTYGILGSILGNLAFNELRTERQLGYIVNGGMSVLGNQLYLSIIVQGTAVSADESEIMAEMLFTKHMLEFLENMSDEEFEAHKSSFRESLLTPPTTYTEEFGHFWSVTKLLGGCSTLLDDMLAFLDESVSSKQVLIDAYSSLIAGGDDGLRNKVVVKYFAGKVPPRLTDTEVEAKLSAEGVATTTVSMILDEYTRTELFTDASSVSRKQLVDQFGFLPQDLGCQQR